MAVIASITDDLGDQPDQADRLADLGNLIRAARARKGWSQNQLAAEVHVGLSSISRWEVGQTEVSALKLLEIGQALGVRFVDDGAGRYQALDVAPVPAPAPSVVVLVAGTAEAMREALDRLGVPKAE